MQKISQAADQISYFMSNGVGESIDFNNMKEHSDRLQRERYSE